jgi:hypothetical protein
MNDVHKRPREVAWQAVGALRLLALTAAFVFVCAMPASLECLAHRLGF